MNEKLAKLGLGFLAMAAIGIPTTFVASAYAQNPPPAGPQGGGVRGQGQFPGQPGQGGQFQRPGGGFGGGFSGGGGAITADGQFLYVLQGNRIFKLDKVTLKVLTEGELPMPRPQFQPGQGAGGFGGGGLLPGQGGNRGGGQAGNRGGGQIPPK